MRDGGRGPDQEPQPLLERREPAAGRVRTARRHPAAGIGHLDLEPVARPPGRHVHPHRLPCRLAAILDRVLDERLHHHRRHLHRPGRKVAVDPRLQAVAEADALDREVFLERVEFPRQGLERGRGPQQEAEVVGQRLRQRLDRGGILAAGHHRVEGVEQEVGADLPLEPLEFLPQRERLGPQGADLGRVAVAEQLRAEVERAPVGEHRERDRRPRHQLGSRGPRQPADPADHEEHERDQHRGEQPAPRDHADLREPQSLEQPILVREPAHARRGEEAEADLRDDEPPGIRHREHADQQHGHGEGEPPKRGMPEPEHEPARLTRRRHTDHGHGRLRTGWLEAGCDDGGHRADDGDERGRPADVGSTP